MNKQRSLWIKRILLPLLAVVISLLMLENADGSFQNDSERLAMGPIVAEVREIETDNQPYGLGILTSLDYPEEDVYSFMEKEAIEGFKYKSYKSQIGLQGLVYKAIVHFIPELGMYYVFRVACCFFLTIILLAIVYQLYKKYGALFAVVFGVVSLISPWVVNFSRNLYWVEFTWFIPMLLGLLCINYEEKRKIIYPLFFIAVLVKCLCGYEYISTIMMSGIMFLIVEFICNRKERKKIFKSIFVIGVLSLAGFLTAYIIHAYIYGSGNIIDGLKHMQVDLIERRTFGNAADFDTIYADSLNASIMDVLIKYFWTSGGPLDGKLMLIVTVVSVAVILYRKIVLKESVKFDASLFIITLWSTISWYVLGKSHSYIHTHMNFVLFYMGWIQSSIYIICKSLIRTNKNRAAS